MAEQVASVAQASIPQARGRYGEFTDLVNVITKNYSQENAEVFRHLRPPIYITAYDKWTVEDVVKLHDTYPNVYASFVGMFNSVFGKSKKDMTPEEVQHAKDAIEAMKVLSGDGDVKRYASMLLEADKVIQARKNPMKKTSLSLDDATSGFVVEKFAEFGVRLDQQNALVSPDPKARALQAIAGMTTKIQRAA